MLVWSSEGILHKELFHCSLHLPFLLKHKIKLLLKRVLEMLSEQIVARYPE